MVTWRRAGGGGRSGGARVFHARPGLLGEARRGPCNSSRGCCCCFAAGVVAAAAAVAVALCLVEVVARLVGALVVLAIVLEARQDEHDDAASHMMSGIDGVFVVRESDVAGANGVRPRPSFRFASGWVGGACDLMWKTSSPRPPPPTPPALSLPHPPLEEKEQSGMAEARPPIGQTAPATRTTEPGQCEDGYPRTHVAADSAQGFDTKVSRHGEGEWDSGLVVCESLRA